MAGSKTTNTSQQTSNPWEPAQGALKDVLGQAQKLSQNTDAFTTTNDATRDALYRFASSPSMTADVAKSVASGSSQGYGQGLSELMATSGGQRMTGNPYMDQALSDASRRTADSVNAQFSGAGRYGSGAHTGVLTDRLGELETKARMDNYSTERQNQLNASNTLLSGGYQGVNAAQAGDAANDARSMALVDVGKLTDAQYNSAKQAPMTALDWMRGNATQIGAMGGQSSGTQTSQQSADKLGMAISAGKMIAGAATGNPMMMASGGSSLASGGGGSSSNPWSWMGSYS